MAQITVTKRIEHAPCDTRGCNNHAAYDIHVAIFGIKLCKACMKELTKQCAEVQGCQIQ